MAVADLITFEHGELGEQNLQQLIKLSTDEDVANRDWAALLLAQLVALDDVRREDVKAALIIAAHDKESCVRIEAACGLVELDRPLALSVIQSELKQDTVISSVFYAAEDLADPSLVEDLREFQNSETGPNDYCKARDALEACLKGIEISQNP